MAWPEHREAGGGTLYPEQRSDQREGLYVLCILGKYAAEWYSAAMYPKGLPSCRFPKIRIIDPIAPHEELQRGALDGKGD